MMRTRGLMLSVLCVAFASSCSLSADRRAQTLAEKAHARPHPPTTTTVDPQTPTTGPPFVYQVRPGDSLGSLSIKFRVAQSVIMARNHLANPNLLREGQLLHIPSAPPLALTITPSSARAGQAFHFELTGAVPSETVTFTIASPTGPFTGDPHTTSDGTV